MDASLLSPHLLPDDQLTRDNCKEYLSRFLAWLHERFDAGDNIIELVATRSEYMDALQEKLREELLLQKERSELKKERTQGEVKITMLRKVSFKREKHALNNRLLSLDTINKKILKC
jgi:predicted RNA binding protein with dsRBD fold (UPF0201 family)